MTREQIEQAMQCCNPYDENCGDCPFNDLPQGRCFELLAKSAFNMLLEDREKLQKQVKEGYQDKIEQGTLIELPCKVGDTVYVGYGASGIDEWEVREIVIVKNNILFRLTHDGTEDYNAAWLSEAGTQLFFTREEAKKRLKELQNG